MDRNTKCISAFVVLLMLMGFLLYLFLKALVIAIGVVIVLIYQRYAKPADERQNSYKTQKNIKKRAKNYYLTQKKRKMRDKTIYF